MRGLWPPCLFVSFANNSALALLLFYLTPLPVLLAGIGWGVRSALLSLIAAAAMLAALLSLQWSLAFALFVGSPSVVLSYLMLLRRQISPATGAVAGAPFQPQIEWYPFGRVVAWAAFLSGSLVSAALILLGSGGEGYSATVHSLFDESAFKQLQDIFGPELTQAEFEQMIHRFTRYILPASAAMLWLLVMAGNLWLATKSASISGLLARPVPAFTRLEYPPFLLGGFLIALALSFSSGMLGIAATAFLGAFASAYLVLGLAVVHVMFAASQFKLMLLFAVYLGLFLTPWVGPPLALLGLLEPFLRLRQRFWQNPTPPANPSNFNL